MSQEGSKPEGPLAVVITRRYLVLLVVAALLGVPISAAAYWFLHAVRHGQKCFFEMLPTALGFETAPAWWPLPMLAIGGLITGAAIQYLPGRGGHSPADGFKAGAPPTPAALPGILLAAFASLSLGAVIGPEAPLIALGSGLAALVVRLRKRDTPDQVIAVVGAAGAFASVAFLLGSPIVGAFLMLEAVGLAGPRAKVVLLPGLLCAGIGFLVAVGIHSWTGIGKVTLTIPNVPAYTHPEGVQFLAAIGFGLLAAVLGTAIRRLALLARDPVEKRPMILTPVAGLAVAALAIVFSQITGKSTSYVLFSGEESLAELVQDEAACTVEALVLLIVCKSLAYSISLASFRGGPVFPSMFIGAAMGILFAHLLGLPVTAGLSMGIGAMAAVMLHMPMTAVLLASLLLGKGGIDAMPLVIVAVVIAFVATEWLAPSDPPAAHDHPGERPAAPHGAPPSAQG
jgi:H+/Cl- antiporter ClcA